MSSTNRDGFGGGGARRSGEVALVGAGEDPAVGSMLAGDRDRGGAACSLDSSLLSLAEIGSSKLNTSSDDESCDLSVRPRAMFRGAGCLRWEKVAAGRGRGRLPRAINNRGV
jgi:hypothetical protein